MSLFDRNFDDADFGDDVLDLDDTGVEDFTSIDSSDLSSLFLPREEGEGFVENMEMLINRAVDDAEEEQKVEEILAELDREPYENYSPPYRDDEDDYDTGDNYEEDDR